MISDNFLWIGCWETDGGDMPPHLKHTNKLHIFIFADLKLGTFLQLWSWGVGWGVGYVLLWAACVFYFSVEIIDGCFLESALFPLEYFFLSSV